MKLLKCFTGLWYSSELAVCGELANHSCIHSRVGLVFSHSKESSKSRSKHIRVIRTVSAPAQDLNTSPT